MHTTHIIQVTEAAASCSCGDSGAEPAPRLWALRHRDALVNIYLHLIALSDGDQIQIQLERQDGGSTEGWRVEKIDGLPVVYDQTGRFYNTVPISTNVRDGQPVMTVRLDRDNPPEVQIIQL